MSTPHDPRISVRIPKGSDLKERLSAAVQQTGISESLLVLRAVEAVLDYIEQHEQITFPLSVREQKPTGRRRRFARVAGEAAKLMPLLAAVFAGCWALIDCELLNLDLFF